MEALFHEMAKWRACVIGFFSEILGRRKSMPALPLRR
jgi:hypothetical protein